MIENVPPGTYEIKGRHSTTAGTLNSSTVNLMAFAMEDTVPDQILERVNMVLHQ